MQNYYGASLIAMLNPYTIIADDGREKHYINMDNVTSINCLLYDEDVEGSE